MNKLFATIVLLYFLNSSAQKDSIISWYPNGDNMFLKHIEQKLDFQLWQNMPVFPTERVMFTIKVSDSNTIDSFTTIYFTNSQLMNQVKQVVFKLAEDKKNILKLPYSAHFTYNLEITKSHNGYNVNYSTDYYIPEPNEKVKSKNRWMIFASLLVGVLIYYYYTQ